MLERVPFDNAIVRDYQKLPSSGVQPMPAELRKLIDDGNKPKCGGKRKEKVVPSESFKVPKKTKNPVKKQIYPSPVIQEESDERTATEVQENDTIPNEEEDTYATFEPATTETFPKVSSCPSSSVPVSGIFFTTSCRIPF